MQVVLRGAFIESWLWCLDSNPRIFITFEFRAFSFPNLDTSLRGLILPKNVYFITHSFMTAFSFFLKLLHSTEAAWGGRLLSFSNWGFMLPYSLFSWTESLFVAVGAFTMNKAGKQTCFLRSVVKIDSFTKDAFHTESLLPSCGADTLQHKRKNPRTDVHLSIHKTLFLTLVSTCDASMELLQGNMCIKQHCTL